MRAFPNKKGAPMRAGHRGILATDKPFFHTDRFNVLGFVGLNVMTTSANAGQLKISDMELSDAPSSPSIIRQASQCSAW
jgi:hypothetical protein